MRPLVIDNALDMPCLGSAAISKWRQKMIAGIGPGVRGLSKEMQAKRMSLYRAGQSDAEIAKKQGVTKNAVLAWRTRRQLPPNPHICQNLDEAAKARRISLFAMDMGDRGVAAKLGRSRSAIRAWRIKQGIKPKQVWRRKDGEIGLLCAVSLDDPQGFERSRYEVIADTSWSNWLEEMGATVW